LLGPSKREQRCRHHARRSLRLERAVRLVGRLREGGIVLFLVELRQTARLHRLHLAERRRLVEGGRGPHEVGRKGAAVACAPPDELAVSAATKRHEATSVAATTVLRIFSPLPVVEGVT
jgi:hypothetical protein